MVEAQSVQTVAVDTQAVHLEAETSDELSPVELAASNLNANSSSFGTITAIARWPLIVFNSLFVLIELLMLGAAAVSIVSNFLDGKYPEAAFIPIAVGMLIPLFFTLASSTVFIWATRALYQGRAKALWLELAAVLLTLLFGTMGYALVAWSDQYGPQPPEQAR
ncbi:MAG: hypothetical protein MK135_08785 [Polyangiaceae bacterium]|nr:hypothetical protein [Polyangiaceae bacterium]